MNEINYWFNSALHKLKLRMKWRKQIKTKKQNDSADASGYNFAKEQYEKYGNASIERLDEHIEDSSTRHAIPREIYFNKGAKRFNSEVKKLKGAMEVDGTGDIDGTNDINETVEKIETMIVSPQELFHK